MRQVSKTKKESGYSAIQDNNPKEKRKKKNTQDTPNRENKEEEILTCRERMDRNGIHDAGFLHLDEAATRNAIDNGTNRTRQATHRLLPIDLGSKSRCR